MAKKKQEPEVTRALQTPEEVAAAVQEDTAQVELEKLQKKIAREERKKRREIEANKQKQAKWLLPALLFATMLVTWMLSRMQFSGVQQSAPSAYPEPVQQEEQREQTENKSPAARNTKVELD